MKNRGTHVEDLEQAQALEQVRTALATLAPREQLIRSQVLNSSRENPKEVRPPQILQFFGQRFVLDSFVLSRVVYDSIIFKNKKRERLLPSGLDVMGALGNNEAIRLLRPQIEKHQYAANLLAVRRTVDEQQPGDRNQNLYTLWLGSLRLLDDVPQISRA